MRTDFQSGVLLCCLVWGLFGLWGALFGQLLQPILSQWPRTSHLRSQHRSQSAGLSVNSAALLWTYTSVSSSPLMPHCINSEGGMLTVRTLLLLPWAVQESLLPSLPPKNHNSQCKTMSYQYMSGQEVLIVKTWYEKRERESQVRCIFWLCKPETSV